MVYFSVDPDTSPRLYGVDHRVDNPGADRGLHCQQNRQQDGSGFLLDAVLGIVGGFIFDALGGIGITGFNLYSMIVAIIGAIIVLWIYHAIFGRKVT